MKVRTKKDWEQRYLAGDTTWDIGTPCAELQRVLDEGWIRPCRMLEIGCGTGTNALFLAAQGFDVVAIDIAAEAVKQARIKASAVSGAVDFYVSDFLELPPIAEPFPFVLDIGTYHTMRGISLARRQYHQVLERITQPGSFYLGLQPSANEVHPTHRYAAIHDYELCVEFRPLFDLVQLRAFRFDPREIQGEACRLLGWSALLQRKARTVNGDDTM